MNTKHLRGRKSRKFVKRGLRVFALDTIKEESNRRKRLMSFAVNRALPVRERLLLDIAFAAHEANSKDELN